MTMRFSRNILVLALVLFLMAMTFAIGVFIGAWIRDIGQKCGSSHFLASQRCSHSDCYPYSSADKMPRGPKDEAGQN